ncbi:MAG: hypothetical protein K8R86_03690, partial [Bacteroidales bacterium]|nr:hypothetical protein [Bacteroidales bacterium]
SYEVEFYKIQNLPDPLNFENLASPSSGDVKCDELERLHGELTKDYSIRKSSGDLKKHIESEIAINVKKFNHLYKDADDKCKNNPELKKLFDEIEKGISVEYELANKFIISKNDKVIIKIKRDNFEWVFEFGNEPSRWHISYGFGFTPKTLEPSTYFLQEVDSSSYSITKKNNPSGGDLRFLPTIHANYIFTNQEKKMQAGITAGLGANTENIAVSLGLSSFINYNIGITIGVAVYSMDKLNSNYNESDIISENLEFDQIHEKVFRPNLFFSLNLRLGKNPFESK